MASYALLKLLKAGPVVARRSPGGLRALVTGAPGGPGPFEGMQDSHMKDSAGPVENVSTETRGLASAAVPREVAEDTESMADNAETMSDHLVEKVENISERAKQTAQDMWGSAKETAQKVKDTVVGKAEDARDYVKENAVDARDYIKENAEDCKLRVEKGAIKEEAKKTVEKAMNTKDC